MSTTTPDPALPYTTFRIALASGILGSIGATLGWLGWLTVRVWTWELLGTILVGGALGVVVHWTRHYVRSAKREHRGEASASEEHSPPAPPQTRTALLWAGSFGFLGLVTEHLVAHMTAEFLVPFLASLAALLPAGIILGWTMNRGRAESDNLLHDIANGAITGAIIAGVTGVIWTIGFGGAPWFALWAWWGLIGIGTRIVTGVHRNTVKPLDPVAAVGMACVAIVLLNLLPDSDAAYTKFGVLANPLVIVRAMAAKIEDSPALPEAFWMQAEERFSREHPDSATLAEAAAKADSIAKARINTLALLNKPVDISGAVNRLTGVDTTTPAVVSGLPSSPKNRAELFRSWLVILLFAIGLGAAPWIEQALRPLDYPNSETYRRDITLVVACGLALVAACAIARVDRCTLPRPIHGAGIGRALACIAAPHADDTLTAMKHDSVRVQ